MSAHPTTHPARTAASLAALALALACSGGDAPPSDAAADGSAGVDTAGTTSPSPGGQASDTVVDFHALGQEPGWMLDVRSGRSIHFLYDYGQEEVRTTAPAPTVDPDTGAVTYHVVTPPHELRVTIDPTRCTDAMSGRPYETTVVVELNGVRFDGCGGPLPPAGGAAGGAVR